MVMRDETAPPAQYSTFFQAKKPKATVKTEVFNIVTTYFFKISSVYLMADLQLFLMLIHLVLKWEGIHMRCNGSLWVAQVRPNDDYGFSRN